MANETVQIWGEKQSEAIRRIFDEAYGLAKDINDHNQHALFTDRMIEAGFVIDCKENDPAAHVSLAICTAVWNRLMKDERQRKIERAEKKLEAGHQKAIQGLPATAWRENLAEAKVNKKGSKRAKKRPALELQANSPSNGGDVG